MAVSSSKKSVMSLYSGPRCPYSHRVRFVLAEKGISAEIHDVDPANPGDDVMDLNPYGTVPTLIDRDLVLYESRIIMEYLDERFPHPPLLPVDPVSRSTTRLYSFRVEKDWYSLMDRILADGPDAMQARKQLVESLIVTAPIFAANDYFMSPDITLVDASIAPLLWRLPMMGINLPVQAQAVIDYADRLFQRESFQSSLTEFEQEMRS